MLPVEIWQARTEAGLTRCVSHSFSHREDFGGFRFWKMLIVPLEGTCQVLAGGRAGAQHVRLAHGRNSQGNSTSDRELIFF